MRLSVDGIRLKNPKKIRTYLLKASRSGLLKNAEVLTPGAGILRIRFKNGAVLLILPERNSYEEQWRLIDVINKEEYHLVYFCKKYQFH